MTGPYLEGKGSWALQMHQLTGPDDAVKTVNFWLDQGVDNFKAYMFITRAELGAAMQAAHKRGAKVTGHFARSHFARRPTSGSTIWSTDFSSIPSSLPERSPTSVREMAEDPVAHGQARR